MTDTNSENTENRNLSEEDILDESKISDELADKLVRELTGCGVTVDEATAQLLRFKLAAAANPEEGYNELRREFNEQLSRGLREEKQLQGTTLAILGILLFAIIGFLSQCANFFSAITSPPMDAAVYRNCIEQFGVQEEYKGFCTREAQEAARKQRDGQ
ncbi:hypothetical protein [Microcoleus sp. herbarium5]|uniref:hypothetical protein n=1 Tax=Microcoleus sp. herbarium5 TaxID=3055434 RepID=UPI002FD1D54F